MRQLKKILAGFTLLMAMSSAFAIDQHAVNGVVTGIKADDKKITISHGPIQSLGMSGMTMDFKVYDPAMLSDVTTGHNVAFVLEKDESGALVIVEIEDQGMVSGAD